MNAKELNQFYTKDSVAIRCMENVLRTLVALNLKTYQIFYLEPSAGNGVFLRAIGATDPANGNACFGCDIDPKDAGIYQCDFLKCDMSGHLPNEKTIVAVGNPPFGHKGKLAAAFVNRAFRYAPIVCFVLPVQFNKFSAQRQIEPCAKLIFNQSLPEESFTINGKSHSVRACFQIWTILKTRLPDQRMHHSPRTEHPDFKMHLYNCTSGTAKYFDRHVYKWDFAVPRQGFKDYGIRETDPSKMSRKVQWMFFKAKDEATRSRLMKLDFEALSLKNTTTPGYGKADVVEEYRRGIIALRKHLLKI